MGNLTFGGGDPTMAALESELVSARGWLTPEKYGLIYALARVTPGTNMLAFCAGAAWELMGWSAAVLAVVATTLPSAALIVALTEGYEKFKANGWAMAAIGGMLAAGVGMMAAGAFQLVRPHLRTGRWVRALVMVAGSLSLSLGLGLGPVQVLALAAAAGAVWRAPEQ